MNYKKVPRIEIFKKEEPKTKPTSSFTCDYCTNETSEISEITMIFLPRMCTNCNTPILNKYDFVVNKESKNGEIVGECKCRARKRKIMNL